MSALAPDRRLQTVLDLFDFHSASLWCLRQMGIGFVADPALSDDEVIDWSTFSARHKARIKILMADCMARGLHSVLGAPPEGYRPTTPKADIKELLKLGLTPFTRHRRALYRLREAIVGAWREFDLRRLRPEPPSVGSVVEEHFPAVARCVADRKPLPLRVRRALFGLGPRRETVGLEKALFRDLAPPLRPQRDQAEVVAFLEEATRKVEEGRQAAITCQASTMSDDNMISFLRAATRDADDVRRQLREHDAADATSPSAEKPGNLKSDLLQPVLRRAPDSMASSKVDSAKTISVAETNGSAASPATPTASKDYFPPPPGNSISAGKLLCSNSLRRRLANRPEDQKEMYMSKKKPTQVTETGGDTLGASHHKSETGMRLRANPFDHVIGDYVINPVAEIFPMMSDAELNELADDIKSNGLLEPIWVDGDNRVIDGRNRLAACSRAGVQPTFRTWSGNGSLVAFVLSQNMHRRHLTVSQRAMAAARAAEVYRVEARERQVAGTNLPANLPQGQSGEWRERAGHDFGASARSVQNAVEVLASGDKELIGAVDSGEVAVSAGAVIAKSPPKEREKALAGGRRGTAKAASEVRKKVRTKKAPAVSSAPKPDVAVAVSPEADIERPSVSPPVVGIAPPTVADQPPFCRFAREVASALWKAGVENDDLGSFFLAVQEEHTGLAASSGRETVVGDEMTGSAADENAQPQKTGLQHVQVDLEVMRRVEDVLHFGHHAGKSLTPEEIVRLVSAESSGGALEVEAVRLAVTALADDPDCTAWKRDGDRFVYSG
jgi:hypothetical protein